MVNGGSEANLLTLWSLLEPGDRLAFMVPNYMQGCGLGSFFGRGERHVRLRLTDDRWALDVDSSHDAVTKRTKAVMVCNPNNPTGHVLTEEEMDGSCAPPTGSARGSWPTRSTAAPSSTPTRRRPTFWGRYERVIVTSGLSKAFAMPGLRVGWAVAPADDDRPHLGAPRLHDPHPARP